MSESAQVIVRLDSPPREVREQIAADILSWLGRKELIVPSAIPKADRERWGLADWAPGPAWRTLCDRDYDLERLLNNGVSVTTASMVESAYGNSENPACRRCGDRFPLHETFDLMDDWLTGGVEPRLTCRSCGWTDLVGEWDAEYPLALIGAPAITFHNWPPLPAAFVNALYVLLGGGRCRFFHARI